MKNNGSINKETLYIKIPDNNRISSQKSKIVDISCSLDESEAKLKVKSPVDVSIKISPNFIMKIIDKIKNR